MYKGSKSRLLVRISREELEDFCLSLDSICKKNRETKLFLQEILGLAAERHGFFWQRDAALRIDVLPSEGGGCFLIFTQESPAKTGTSAEKTTQQLIAFPNTNAFLDCLNAYLKTASSETKGADFWYRRAQRFYALLPAQQEALLPLFSEYGSVHRLTAEACARFREEAEYLSVFGE